MFLIVPPGVRPAGLDVTGQNDDLPTFCTPRGAKNVTNNELQMSGQ